MATMTGHSHLLTAHQGDADDREENRDAKDKHPIHPRILQIQVPERKGHTQIRPNKKRRPTFSPAIVTALRSRRDLNTPMHTRQRPCTRVSLLASERGCPVVSLCRLHRLDTNTQYRLLSYHRGLVVKPLAISCMPCVDSVL